MNQKFQNKYRIPSARAPWWDYGANAAYFITICTRNREHYFGEIIQNTMHLTEIGKQAEMCWNAIPEHFPFVLLDEFVVMPNHIHGILIFNKNGDDKNKTGGTNANRMDGFGMGGIVQTQNFASVPTNPTNPDKPNHAPSAKNKFGPLSQNLGSVVRGFKIGVTKFANNNNLEFGWQPRYHDHIIRNEAEFQRIKHYIATNPQNWNNDKFRN